MGKNNVLGELFKAIETKFVQILLILGARNYNTQKVDILCEEGLAFFSISKNFKMLY